MAVHFTVRDDGIIEARVGSGEGLLNLALNDAIGSRAPRGAVSQGLSTYWIDRTEAALHNAMEHGITEPFASGNVTYVRLDGDRVVAGYDFDPDEGEAQAMPLKDFLVVLGEWRRTVMDAGGASGEDAAVMTADRPTRPMGPAT